jgi:hypothetical protein
VVVPLCDQDLRRQPRKVDPRYVGPMTLIDGVPFQRLPFTFPRSRATVGRCAFPGRQTAALPIEAFLA